MKKYLQYRRGYICIWMLLCIVPILVQMLYGQALESVLYGSGLATVLVLLFMVHDFSQFREISDGIENYTGYTQEDALDYGF